MAWSWEPSMTAVKIVKRRASNVKNNKKITVAGGLKVVQSCHSCLTQLINWLMHKYNDCKEIIAI